MSKREDVCVWSKDEMVCDEMKRLRAKVTELEADREESVGACIEAGKAVSVLHERAKKAEAKVTELEAEKEQLLFHVNRAVDILESYTPSHFPQYCLDEWRELYPKLDSKRESE
jgi:hypothetical protein